MRVRSVETANLAEIGCTCLLLLVMKNGDRFTPHMWNIVCATFEHVLACNLPVEVFDYQPTASAANSGAASAPSPATARLPRPVPISELNESAGLRPGQLPPAALRAVREAEAADAESRAATTATQSLEEVAMVKLRRATPRRAPHTFTSFPVVNGRCTIHLLLIQAVNEVFFEHYTRLSLGTTPATAYVH